MNQTRFPHRILTAASARYWANRRLKEGSASEGVRDFTRRAAKAFVLDGNAKNMKAGKVLARQLLARAAQLFAAKLSQRTPAQAIAA